MSPGRGGRSRCGACDIPGNGICAACRGRGKTLVGHCVQCVGSGCCPRCNGTGNLRKTSGDLDLYAIYRRMIRFFKRGQCQECEDPGNGKCATCHGLGHTLTQTCAVCEGTAKCANCNGTGHPLISSRLTS